MDKQKLISALDNSLHPLWDPKNKISDEFQVPPQLMKRTQFWFDIYTHYDSYTKVIHHSEFPWIIIEAIDSKSLYEKEKNPIKVSVQFEKIVKKRVLELNKSLKNLIQKKGNSLTEEEQKIFSLLSHHGFDKKKDLLSFKGQFRSQTGQKNHFINAYVESGRYLKSIEAEFNRLKIPHELSRLPFVESSFNTKAMSKVGASGIWQIMPLTGQYYGIVNDVIDERNSPFKASLFAGKLLQYNFKVLKTWPLAITAYNHGVGTLKKITTAAQSSDIEYLIRTAKHKAFQFASKNFFTCFLAALHAEYYASEIFHKESFLDQRAKPYILTKLTLNKQTTLNEILKTHGLKRDDFLGLNLDLKKIKKINKLLPKGFQYFIPTSLLLKLDKNLNYSEQKKPLSDFS